MGTTPARQRLAECAGRWKLCEVQGCHRQVQKWGKFCEAHDNTNERTGDPEGHTVRVSTLKPYLGMATRYITAHPDHLAIQAALRWFKALVYQNRPHVTYLREHATAHERLDRWLWKMKKQGIEPERLLAMVAAFYLMRADHPREFKSDRHFNHQLAVRLLRMIRAPWAERWAGGKPYRRYDRITVGVRDLLSKTVNDALGSMCLRMSEAILAGVPQHQQPTVLEGIDTAFPTPSNRKDLQ